MYSESYAEMCPGDRQVRVKIQLTSWQIKFTQLYKIEHFK